MFLTALWWLVGGPLREETAVTRRQLQRATQIHDETIRVLADYQERLIRANEDLVQATKALTQRSYELQAHHEQMINTLTVFDDALDRRAQALEQARAELRQLLKHVETTQDSQALSP